MLILSDNVRHMNTAAHHLSSAFASYRQRIEAAIEQSVSNLGPPNELREACAYALLNGGKRFRPAIVFLIADALGHNVDVTPAALAVEFFHTASLVADDLPCMDDDAERRNQPTVHKVYGEATALLVSYALIAAGYGLLAENAKQLAKRKIHFSAESDRICVLALENAAYNTGLCGATGGQFLDIYPENLSLQVLRDVIHKKTISLFEISFVLGWLFGGGNVSDLNKVKQLASHFGMAFQIADDLEDREQDVINGRKVNLANALGVEKAKLIFQEELIGFQQTLKSLELCIPVLEGMANMLNEQVRQL